MKKIDCEGYVIIAGIDQHYLELAVNAACSIRVNDSRPIALLIFGGLIVPKQYLFLFDHIIAFDPEGDFMGVFTKYFYLDKYTPYKRTIYVDGDCFLVSNQIDSLWKQCHDKPFFIMGHEVTNGIFFSGKINVDNLISAGICKSFFSVNTGVFYFQSDGNNSVMQECRWLLEQMARNAFSFPISYYAKPMQLSDEPIWGIALSKIGGAIEVNYSMMTQATTPNSKDFFFDWENNKFSFTKSTIKNVTGYFVHFCALEPLNYYLQGMIFYREKIGIDLPFIGYDEVTIAPNDWKIKYNELDITKNWRLLSRV